MRLALGFLTSMAHFALDLETVVGAATHQQRTTLSVVDSLPAGADRLTRQGQGSLHKSPQRRANCDVQRGLQRRYEIIHLRSLPMHFSVSTGAFRYHCHARWAQVWHEVYVDRQVPAIVWKLNSYLDPCPKHAVAERVDPATILFGRLNTHTERVSRGIQMSMVQLPSNPDSPNLLKPQWWLLTEQFSFVPGRCPPIDFGGGVHEYRRCRRKGDRC